MAVRSSRQREADNVTAGRSVLTDLLVLTHTVYELELGRKAEDRTWSSRPSSPHTTTTTTQQSRHAQFFLFHLLCHESFIYFHIPIVEYFTVIATGEVIFGNTMLFNGVLFFFRFFQVLFVNSIPPDLPF